jgi:DNA repair protein REV1
LKKKREGAPESAKYLGHGIADNLSKGKTLDFFTNDPEIIFKESLELLKILGVPPQDLRGIGLHMQKLDNEQKSPAKINNNQPMIQKFFRKENVTINENAVTVNEKIVTEQNITPSSNLDPLPPFSQLDMAVLDKLPLPIKRELELAYKEKQKAGKKREISGGSLFTNVKKDTRKEILVTIPTPIPTPSASPVQDENLSLWKKVT